MSKLSDGVLGLLAAAFALGAVHLEVASGSGLAAQSPRDADLRDISLQDVNRGAKADRSAVSVMPDGRDMLFSFVVPAQDTLIVARFAQKRDGDEAQPSRTAKSDNKVACEISVSSLVAVAKGLRPGRCMV